MGGGGGGGGGGEVVGEGRREAVADETKETEINDDNVMRRF